MRAGLRSGGREGEWLGGDGPGACDLWPGGRGCERGGGRTDVDGMVGWNKRKIEPSK